MPFFSRVFKSKDASAVNGKNKAHAPHGNGYTPAPAKPRYVSTWTSKEVDPAEIEELVHVCTLEMKSRAEALDAPFLLLPFRPDTDTSPSRVFIQNFFAANKEGSSQYTGSSLRKEVVLTDPAVLCSILKWCWSRMPGGVVTWTVYQGFKMGERDSKMARNAFTTFVPLSVDSPARKAIIYDFFDLLAAISAHAKSNGLGGRKLSRMAGWWAFEHSDDKKGFDGGYKSWLAAADASSHLFFAYLRSLEPESLDGFTGINALPRSLQALAAQTEYPPQTPTLLQRKTPKVVMLVDSVSPGPFALLRRAKHFEYRDEELQVFAEYPDPVQALTEECRRVLNRIAAANQSTAARSQAGMNLSMPGLAHQPDESWSRFQDFGFSDFSQASARHGATSPSPEGLSSVPRSRATNKGRPTTPSWADFLNSGFADEAEAGSTPVTLLLPPDKVLPPIGGPTSPTLSSMSEEDLEPGELASIAHFDLDDTFWWVWITSLANEEPSDRKAVFGRCALVETGIMGGRWLLMEEQVKGAAPEPQEAAYIAEKKSRFGFSRRNKATRRRSGVPAKSAEILQTALRPASASPRSGSVTSDQQAKIKAAAAALAHHSRESERDHGVQRRGRHDEAASVKTNSVMTLGLTNEAVPAMKWARDFDREAIRKQYLGNDFAGKGSSKETTLPSQPTVQAGESASAPLTPAEQLPTEDFVATLAPEKDKELQDVYALPRAGHTQPGASAEVTKADPVGELTSAPAVEPLTASESPSPAASPKVSQELPPKQVMPVERKPAPRTAPRINNIHDHPAFRAHNGETGLAERAARQAWGTESKAFSSVAPKAAGQGGFRKLFGKRRDDIKRTSISGPSSVASLQPPSESNLGRKLSLMRKKTPTSPPPDRDLGEPTAASHASLTPEEPYGSPNDSNSISHVGSQDQADAEHAFSRFDQGPLTDAPAFTPRESIDSSASLDSDHGLTNLDHVEAPGAFPETPMEYPSPVETGGNGYTSETSQPGADRWAQIKKNAAERAARMSEDQQSRPSHSVLSEKTDDGETSGEETIEARVARIKARVAELTGNYEPQTNGVRR